jgi:hypothetical protein
MSKEKKLHRKIQEMTKRSLGILGLPNNISIFFESIGDRFQTLENASELEGNKLYVNIDWLNLMETQNNESEIRLLIYHEMRHVYQISQITKWRNRQQVKEDLVTITRWEAEFSQYRRNVGNSSTLFYYRQFVEIDAYAFGIYLLNLDVDRGEKLKLETKSLPDEVFPAIMRRVQEIANKYKK